MTPTASDSRVLFELLGVAIGIYVGWSLCSGHWREHLGRRRG